MGHDERQQLPSRPHLITIENRNTLTITGVDDVESFDENEIVMITAQGSLVVRGNGLHICNISLDTGDLRVEGVISDLCYEDIQPTGSVWARLFR